MGTQANNALFLYLFYFLFIGSITLTYLRSRVSIIRNAHIYVCVCMCMYICMYICIYVYSDPIRSDPIRSLTIVRLILQQKKDPAEAGPVEAF